MNMITMAQLTELIQKVFDGEIDTVSLTPESNLREDVGLNSIAMLYMAVAIEERFGVKLMNDDLPRMVTVGDVLALIEERRGA